MSNKYKSPSEVPVNTLCERLRELGEHASNGNISEFYMRIPAECDRDADIVLSESANRLEQQAAEIAALREFAKYIIKAVNESKTLDIVDINDAARDTNLIDQSGKPTALLTGESG